MEVAGTHPTGMLSCLVLTWFGSHWYLLTINQSLYILLEISIHTCDTLNL